MTNRLRDATRRTFSSLHTRNFRLFFVGQLISNSGNWLTTVTLTLLVLDRTGSGAAIGALAACQYGPILLLSAWAGLVADRMNKRKLLFVTQGLEMCQSLVLAALAFMRDAPLPAYYATAIVGGCLLAFDNPARRSFVNEMVVPAEIPNAVTLYSAMVNMSRIVGPAIGSILVATVGYGWCFLVDGVSYVVVIGALAMMRPAELHRATPPAKGRGQVRAGVRYILGNPALSTTFLVVLVIGLASYNFTVVLPLFAKHALHGSDAQYATLYTTFGAGAVLGTLCVARRVRVRVRTVLVWAAAFGGAMLVLAVVPNLALAYPAVALVGGTSVAYLTAATSVAQLQSTSEMIGRVTAIQTVLMIGTTPIGGLLLGLLADAAGARWPVVIGGLAAIAVALYGWIVRHGGDVGTDRTSDGARPSEPGATAQPASGSLRRQGRSERNFWAAG